MEIRNPLDWVVESIEEASHCLQIRLLHIGSDNCDLHLLVVLFDGLSALLEFLELLEEVASMVHVHKSRSHDLLQWGLLLALINVL